MVKTKTFNRRELRGLAIVAIGGQIQRVNDNLFLVKFQSAPEIFHRVAWTDGKWTCNCLDYTERSKPCKHIYAVNFLLDLPLMVLSNSEAFEKRCPYCGSSETTLKGFRYNKTGAVRIRKCKGCRKRFKDTFHNESISVKEALAIVALDLYFKGLSLRDIQNHIWQIYGVDKPVSTLHRWIVKLIEMLNKAFSEIKSTIGDRWLADETIVKVNGQARYLWNILDYETRCYIVSVITEGRGAEEALEVIKSAIERTGKYPKQFVTDGLKSYSKALEMLKDIQIKHISNVGLASPENNNRIERLHGTIKDWTKNKRGMKNHSQELIDGYRLYYNHLRPNIALEEKTPANKNKKAKWISLINK
ncbi:MAG: DDE-type integrase/transposase/recombinase [Candidatus Jordarchaeaceae archaeon]